MAASPPLEVTLKHKSAEEFATREQLERVRQGIPASWYFTRAVEIDEAAIPHSHPVLTLHTRHLKDDDLLLSSFIHEQLHWFLSMQKETEAAKVELRQLFPKIPVGFPDGADSEDSGYLHLLVNYLEWRADEQVIGELRARQIMEFWTHDHYRSLYQMVLDHSRDIGRIVIAHHLMLPH
jgi:hypothetical protein